MKKIILLAILYFTLQAGIRAQSTANDSLNINNINARIWADNVNFWDHQGQTKYMVNSSGGSITTMFNQTLQLGGIDSLNQLHYSYVEYGGNNVNSFQVGPISNSYGSSFHQQYNMVWKINRCTIDSFIQFNGNSNYIVPDIIKYWPAHGDVSKGQSLYLAPFYDINNDGIYDYQSGDYPLIKGDQAIFYIFNDDTIPSTSTGLNPLKVEVLVMAYAFSADCDTNSALRNTIFFNYRIRNRSNNTYTNTYLKLFSDIDIGNGYNDRVGCDVKRSAYFGYNAANSNYDSVKVAQGVVFLEGPYMDPDGIDNPYTNSNGAPMCDESINGSNFGDGIIDNERLGLSRFIASYNIPNNYPPDSVANMNMAEILYAEMDGDLKVYYGSQGLQYDSLLSPKIPAKYMFLGLSDSCYLGTGGIAFPGGQNWIDTTNYPVTPHDRRGNGFTGPFTFSSGESVELDIAMVTSFSDTGTVFAGIPELKQAIDSVRYYYFNNIDPCNGTSLGINDSYLTDIINEFAIYPNPASTYLYLRYSEDMIMTRYNIYDITGRAITGGLLNKKGLTKISLKEINSGLYILVIENDNQRITKKFIVNK